LPRARSTHEQLPVYMFLEPLLVQVLVSYATHSTSRSISWDWNCCKVDHLQLPACMMVTPPPKPHVLVVPFPAQGHILALLDHAALLATRRGKLSVTVAITAGIRQRPSPRAAPGCLPVRRRRHAGVPFLVAAPPAGLRQEHQGPPVARHPDVHPGSGLAARASPLLVQGTAPPCHGHRLRPVHRVDQVPRGRARRQARRVLAFQRVLRRHLAAPLARHAAETTCRRRQRGRGRRHVPGCNRRA